MPIGRSNLSLSYPLKDIDSGWESVSFLSRSATLALSSASSSAALLLTFNEVGGNVVMTTSGDVDLNGAWSSDSTSSDPVSRAGDHDGVFVFGPGAYEFYQGTDTLGSFMFRAGFNASTSNGSLIYIFGTDVAVWDGGIDDDTAPANSSLNPAVGTSITWNATDFDFLFGADTIPHKRNVAVSLWQNDTVAGADGNISFSLGAVPEPSSTALLGLGSLGLLLRRRR